MAADRPDSLVAAADPGHAAAEAEADDADRADILHRVDGGLGVKQHRRPVGIGDELARHRDLFGRIAALEVGFDAIEDRRRDGDIAVAGDTVADRANVVIDAEDFLNHHHRRLGRACRVGAIAAQLKVIRSGQFDILSHGSSICWGLLRVDRPEEIWIIAFARRWRAGPLPFIATSSCGPNRPSSRPIGRCGIADRAGPCGTATRCHRCCGRPDRFHRRDGR